MSMSKTFSEKIDKNFDVSFSSALLVLSRFRVFLSDKRKKRYKKRFTKKSCRKVFTKKSTKKSKTDFSRFFNHVLGRFSGEKKILKKSDQPWYFFGPLGTNQPRRGPSPFFLSVPCSIANCLSVAVAVTPSSQLPFFSSELRVAPSSDFVPCKGRQGGKGRW
jgi:hypothetical protein